MPNSSNLYEKFKWHFGVVEDRNDPLKLGRLRVRWQGVHTEKLDKIPTKKLPWATPINPINSSMTSGIGGPATGIVEGTWVIGFFADEDSYHKPFVMGSIAGMPEEPADPSVGFYDPNAVYPRTDKDGYNVLDESDLPRLARGKDNAETHASLIQKRETIVKDIPLASAASVKSVAGDQEDLPYKREAWQEPKPQGLDKSETMYPLNHVRETESGHIFEVDDTKGYERIHQQHRSGSYEEIIADGTRQVKIVGDDYEIVVRNKKMFVDGDMDLTVTGNLRLKVGGNFITEVGGTSSNFYHGDKIEKITKNHATEIMTDRGTQINGNNAIRIAGSETYKVETNQDTIIGGEKMIKTNLKETRVNNDKLLHNIAGKEDRSVGGNYNLTVTGDKGMSVLADPGRLSLASKDTATFWTTNNMVLFSANNRMEHIGANNTLVVKAHSNVHIWATHDEIVNGALTGLYNNTYTSNTVGEFTSDYQNTFTEAVVGALDGTYQNTYTSNTVGVFTSEYQNTFTEAVIGAVAGTYSNTVTEDVTGNYTANMAANFSETVGGTYTEAITGAQDTTAASTTINNDTNIIGTITHTGDQTSSGTVTGSTDVVGGGKSLKDHTHTDTAGLGAGTTSAPN